MSALEPVPSSSAAAAVAPPLDKSGDRAAHVLARAPLFESLSDGERRALAGGLEHRHLQQGETLFEEGDEGGRMYLIEDGAIDISVRAGSTAVVVASLYKGQHFGELSIFDGMRST